LENTAKTVILNCLNGKINLISLYSNLNKLKIYEKSSKKNNTIIEKHFKNGKLAELRQYKNNLLNGEQINFSETGDTIYYCNYLNGKLAKSNLNGRHKKFNVYGGLSSISNYKNGLLDGELIHYIDNKLVCVKNYSNGILKGLTTHYDRFNRFTKYENWSNNENDCAVIIKDSLNHILESFFYKKVKSKYDSTEYNLNGNIYYESYFYYQDTKRSSRLRL
jgi:antitoxin component YwqK of YwqJK toxin-antitoxin module